jgi:hypothetical protein
MKWKANGTFQWIQILNRTASQRKTSCQLTEFEVNHQVSGRRLTLVVARRSATAG